MVLSKSIIAIMTSYLVIVALQLTARPALCDIFLSVEGAGHWWISRTFWAIFTVNDCVFALIAFQFLWSLRVLRDSRGLRIFFIAQIQNRWALFLGAWFRVITESYVPTLGASDKFFIMFSRHRDVLAILTFVFQFI